MRAAPALVVGLIAGGALGFLLRGWFGEDAAPAEPTRSVRAPAAPESAPALPSPTWSPAAPQALAPLPDAEAASGDPAVAAAADALVGILVHGAVLDPDGRPATLGTSSSLQFDDGLGKPRTVEVGPESTYAISGLAPGAWKVWIDAQGFRPWRKELALSAAQPVVRLDIVLQPAVVLDIKAVTPSGEPLVETLRTMLQGGDSWNARLGAIATRDPPPTALPETSLRLYDRWGIGSFSDSFNPLAQGEALPKEMIGRLELDESLPLYVSLMFRHLVLQTQTVAPGSREVDFVVPPAALEALLGGVRVRVVDSEARQPIAKAYANLYDSQSSGGGASADATGVFEWERQRPGLLELTITAPDHERWDGEVSVPPGGVADLGTLELSPALAIRGVVRDEDGQPRAVKLSALTDEPRAAGRGARTFKSSGADGRFEWKGFGRRRYRLVVSDDEWTTLPVPVDLRGGDVNDVRITVVRGVLVRLRLRWPSGEQYDVRVETDDGAVIASSENWQSDWIWTRRLAPGAYVAVASSAGRDLRRVPFEVGAADVSVELAP